MRTYELTPMHDRAKSFYRKAMVEHWDNGLQILTSYNTQVAAIVNGQPVRLWSGYSVTTMRHVNEFFAQAGINKGGKAFWDSLPVQHENSLILPVVQAAAVEYAA